MSRLPAMTTRLGATLAGTILALAVGLIAFVSPAAAQDSVEDALGGLDAPATITEVDDALSGFDDDEAALDRFDDETVDDALDGFDDDAVDDALDGFDDDAVDDALDGFDDDAPAAPPTTGTGAGAGADERFYDISGSVSLGASINVVPHRSDLGPGETAEFSTAGTDYVGLQRLRSRGDLQIDVHLPFDWELRAQGFLWFDFAYLINGRDAYTDPVLNDYEFVAEVLDLWVAGTLFDRLDVKLGRQVVNWGRSDTLRVTDVLNALDNREPGLADIENLRLPSTMAKLDYYVGAWSFSALVIPEIRYDYNPPAGSDFFDLPDLSTLPPPVPPIPPIEGEFDFPFDDQRASRWGSTPEFGGSIDGIFSGWDVSFYAANVYQNRATFTPGLPGAAPGLETLIEDDRVTMVGGGGNYTWGSWLFKTELAWFHDVEYVVLDPVPAPDYYAVERIASGRVDFMGGVEYYGFVDTTIALEIVNRHIVDYDPLLEYYPNYIDENSVEYALRVSTDWMNARLHTTLLALVLGHSAQGGALLRGQVDYDVLDALVATIGFVAYVPTENPPLADWGKNQRAFLKLKYSF